MASDRQGDPLTTYTGRQFWPLDPRAEDIGVHDVAHALANLCRYGGHSRRFYSVAEHSVYVSHLVPVKYALEGLLHDASEAYVGDMIYPLKRQPAMVAYRQAEAVVALTVRVHFDLRMTDLCWKAVNVVDERIRMDEMRVLSARPPQGVGFGIKIHCWDPMQAEERFLDRFARLWETRCR